MAERKWTVEFGPTVDGGMIDAWVASMRGFAGVTISAAPAGIPVPNIFPPSTAALAAPAPRPAAPVAFQVGGVVTPPAPFDGAKVVPYYTAATKAARGGRVGIPDGFMVYDPIVSGYIWRWNSDARPLVSGVPGNNIWKTRVIGATRKDLWVGLEWRPLMLDGSILVQLADRGVQP